MFISLPSSFAPFIISLCLQSCASSSSMLPCVVSCLALPCLALIKFKQYYTSLKFLWSFYHILFILFFMGHIICCQVTAWFGPHDHWTELGHTPPTNNRPSYCLPWSTPCHHCHTWPSSGWMGTCHCRQEANSASLRPHLGKDRLLCGNDLCAWGCCMTHVLLRLCS